MASSTSFVLGRMLMVLAACGLSVSIPVTYLTKKDLELSSFKCGQKCGNETLAVNCSNDGLDFYRYLSFSDDQKHLYVGAMNYFFKLNATDLTCFHQKHLPIKESDIQVCVLQGKNRSPDCQNHVRNLIEMGDVLKVCSTGGYAPKQEDFVMTTWEKKPVTFPSSELLCPFDPFDNATSIKIVDGNPENVPVPYFGTYTDFMKNFPIIFRPEFKSNTTTYKLKITDTEDVNWLYSPQFVGSFDVDKEVFFFFREKAIEADDSGNKIYSRVAKVCKKDLGGTVTGQRKWLSFQKARLICSLPGSDPYYFDDIYDVYQSGDLFFALFFKQGANLNASAICVYSKAQIRNVFSGPFQAKDQYGNWRKVQDTNEPRPDMCEFHETLGVFNQSTSRSKLMFNNVEAQYSKPIFYQHGIQLMRLVVTDSLNGSRNIYAASSEGEIHNIFMKEQEASKVQTIKTSIYAPFAPQQFPIWNLRKYGDSLILGSDYNVNKISLNVCQNIKKIDTCILNTECKWCESIDCQNKRSPYTNTTRCWDHNTLGADKHIYHILQEQGLLKESNEQRDAVTGLWVSLDIDKKVSLDSSVVWRHNNKVLSADANKYAKTSGGSLVIRNIQEDDAGEYEALLDDIRLTRIILKTIDSNDNDNLIKKWKQEFIMWSGEFQKWRSCASDYLSTCNRQP